MKSTKLSRKLFMEQVDVTTGGDRGQQRSKFSFQIGLLIRPSRITKGKTLEKLSKRKTKIGFPNFEKIPNRWKLSNGWQWVSSQRVKTWRSRLYYPGYFIPFYKVGCAFQMVVVSKLPHTEFGRNGHREDAPHFNFWFHSENFTLVKSLPITPNTISNVDDDDFCWILFFYDSNNHK